MVQRDHSRFSGEESWLEQAKSSWRRYGKPPDDAVLFNQFSNKAGCLGFFHKISQERGCETVAFGCADGLLHGGELAIQNACARNALHVVG